MRLLTCESCDGFSRSQKTNVQLQVNRNDTEENPSHNPQMHPLILVMIAVIIVVLYCMIMTSEVITGMSLCHKRPFNIVSLLQYVDQQTLKTDDESTTMFYFINISGCSTYSSVHCRRQSISCCSRSSVEQSSITSLLPPLSLPSAVS